MGRIGRLTWRAFLAEPERTTADLLAYVRPSTRYWLYQHAYRYADRVARGRWRRRDPMPPPPKQKHTGYRLPRDKTEW